MRWKDRAERLALELIERHGCGRGGAGQLPVDPAFHAEAHGAQVRTKPMEPSTSGMLLRPEDGSVWIVVNSTHSDNRRRFSIAHELGHLLLHPSTDAYVDSFGTAIGVNLRDERAARGTNRFEIEANAFAASLLMPEPLVREMVVSLPAGGDPEDEVAELAEQFGVSEQAMTYRLTNLGFIKPRW